LEPAPQENCRLLRSLPGPSCFAARSSAPCRHARLLPQRRRRTTPSCCGGTGDSADRDCLLNVCVHVRGCCSADAGRWGVEAWGAAAVAVRSVQNAATGCWRAHTTQLQVPPLGAAPRIGGPNDSGGCDDSALLGCAASGSPLPQLLQCMARLRQFVWPQKKAGGEGRRCDSSQLQ
jgi:hypothetical protein